MDRILQDNDFGENNSFVLTHDQSRMATVKGQSSDLPKSMAEESDGSEEQKHKSIQSHTISFFGLGGRDDGSQSASQNQAPTKDMRVYYVLLTEDKQLHSFGPCRFNEEEWKKRYCPAQVTDFVSCLV